jgi:hypothetical protein
MHSNQNHKWNDDTCDTSPVGLGVPGVVASVSLFNGFSDLEGEGSGNRAGEISGANRFSLSEAKESKVIGSGVTMSVAARSWSSPSRDGLAFSNELQGETSVNIFDSSKADFTFGQWVSDNNKVGFDFHLGENVVSPNQSEQEQHNRASSQTVLLIEPNRLNHGQAGQYQARYGNYVARSRSVIHSQILSRQEANYVAG